MFPKDKGKGYQAKSNNFSNALNDFTNKEPDHLQGSYKNSNEQNSHSGKNHKHQKQDSNGGRPLFLKPFRIIILLIIVLLLGGVAAYQHFYQQQDHQEAGLEEEKELVSITHPERRDIEKTTSIIGNVEPAEQRIILPEMTGTVEELHVEEGDVVEKGDLLFALDDTDYRIQLEEARAAKRATVAQYREAQAGAREEELEEARSTVATAESAKEQAEREMERIETLHQEGYVSDQEYEQVEMQYINAREQLRSAEAYLAMAKSGARQEQLDALSAQVDQANLAVQLAENALERTRVTAPADGEIAVLEIEKGEMAGTAEPAAIMTAEAMQVTASLPERYVNMVSAGDSVEIEVRSAREQNYEGEINKIGTLPAEESMSYPVEIIVDGEEGIEKLKSGMYSRVTLAVDRTGNALVIPRQAILQDETGAIVYVVNQDYEIEQREVTTGINEAGYIEIIQGLDVGDRVVVQGQNNVMPGDAVDTIEYGSEGDLQ